MIYLGHLPHFDPLFDYLKYDIMPQLGIQSKVEFRVFKLNGSNAVYRYEEINSRRVVIGKFFHCNGTNRDVAARRLKREFHHLELMRYFGFDGRSAHYVARPLGMNQNLNELLVEECCYGELFSHIIDRAIRTRDDKLLYAKLTSLAYFLAKFHNTTANGYPVDFSESCNYMDVITNQLLGQKVINWEELRELNYRRECWRGKGEMWSDCQVLVHGDATPENFLFGDNLHVITFDLERLRRSDRVYDVGRVAGELAHFFMVSCGNRYLAEPFIGHFLWEYACHFPDREKTFQAIGKRVPFFMGINFLRIARNNYLT
ncbi:MAG: aminoglycoside phosphotransferase family protein, partial [Victivallaceae bacterium]